MEIMTAWNRNIPFFVNEIVPITKNNPIDVLEIGSYQGASTKWMLENLLKHPECTITCIDMWETSSQHEGVDFGQVENLFDKNVSEHISKIRKLKGTSWDKLIYLNQNKSQFDLIYVDGDHSAQGVIKDLVLAWPLLKLNGIIICDDYVWKENMEAWFQGHRDYKSPLETPKMAIDAFTLIYSDKIRHWMSYYLAGTVAFMKIED